MTPYIDPAIFYWMRVADFANLIFEVISVLSTLAITIIGVVLLYSTSHYGREDEDVLFLKKVFKIFTPIAVISILGVIFIPTKQNIIEMIVAQQITPNALDMAGETIERGLDHIGEIAIKIIEASK